MGHSGTENIGAVGYVVCCWFNCDMGDNLKGGVGLESNMLSLYRTQMDHSHRRTSHRTRYNYRNTQNSFFFFLHTQSSSCILVLLPRSWAGTRSSTLYRKGRAMARPGKKILLLQINVRLRLAAVSFSQTKYNNWLPFPYSFLIELVHALTH